MKTLRQNATLESLSVNDCNIDLNQAMVWAEGLPEFSLRHLSMAGNPFCQSGSHQPLRMHTPRGVWQLVQALRGNRKLLTLDFHWDGEVNWESDHMLPSTLKLYKELLDRNNALHDSRMIRFRHSIVKLAKLLLPKMSQVSRN